MKHNILFLIIEIFGTKSYIRNALAIVFIKKKNIEFILLLIEYAVSFDILNNSVINIVKMKNFVCSVE